MGDDYYACYICPHCRGFQITLPVKKNGSLCGAVPTRCGDCGTSLVSPYHEVSAYSSKKYGPVRSPKRRFKKLDHNLTLTPKSTPKPRKSPRWFPERDAEELGEMLVAVNLLLDEYPESGNYMPTLKKHLEEDVAQLRAEAGK